MYNSSKQKGEFSMKKKSLALYMAATLVLSGCSLSREAKYDEARIEPVVTSEQTEITVKDDIALKSYLKAPSTKETYQEIVEYIHSLEGDNQVVVYDGTSALTETMIGENDKKGYRSQVDYDQQYSELMFQEALKQNPMIQIYYCGNEKTKFASREEEILSSIYPNVTYVSTKENVDEQIEKHYKDHQVTGYCIKKFREVEEGVENFDINKTVEEAQGKFHVDKDGIMNGLTRFGEYVTNTSLFQKAEEVTDKVSEALEPYVERAIPKVQEAWESAKPYVDKAKDLYETAKPKVQEGYEKVKEKVKGFFE